MRTSTDKLNVSLSSTGPYMFFNDGGTLGTYNTNTSSFPWFIEMSGLGSFQNVNCKKLTVENIKSKTIVMNTVYEMDLLTTSPQMIYLNSASDSIFFYLNALGESCYFNIYKFRLQTSNVNSVMRFRGSLSNCPIIDLNNNSTFLFNDDTKQQNVEINLLK